MWRGCFHVLRRRSFEDHLEVVRNTASTNLELKKLNYLYIINYAKAYPDQIIMAIESFKKVASYSPGCPRSK